MSVDIAYSTTGLNIFRPDEIQRALVENGGLPSGDFSAPASAYPTTPAPTPAIAMAPIPAKERVSEIDLRPLWIAEAADAEMLSYAPERSRRFQIFGNRTPYERSNAGRLAMAAAALMVARKVAVYDPSQLTGLGAEEEAWATRVVRNAWLASDTTVPAWRRLIPTRRGHAEDLAYIRTAMRYVRHDKQEGHTEGLEKETRTWLAGDLIELNQEIAARGTNQRFHIMRQVPDGDYEVIIPRKDGTHRLEVMPDLASVARYIRQRLDEIRAQK